jgi:hypothetical protein
VLEVPYESDQPPWQMARYLPTRQIGAVAPACPSRPWWWLLVAAAAGGAASYYMTKPKKKGRASG